MLTAERRGRARVLVLDDEREMGSFLVDLLSDEGYTTEAYQRGTEVVAALEKKARTYSSRIW